VHFRENWMIPLNDNAANVLGAFFAASAPGSYRLHTPGEVDHVQRMLFFSADFVELRNITVKALSVAPAFSSADPIFETEQATFVIVGDPAAPGYQIRYKAAPPAPVPAGTISGLIFTAPVLPGAAAVTHNLEIFVTYPVNAAIFQGKGQVGPTRLTTGAQRTNVCQDLIFDVAPIVTPVIPDVPAGSQATFTMPIAPASIDVTSPIPAGAASNASVQNGTGRPATLTFIAPDHVNANVTVTFNLNFGSGANVKTVPASVNVTPA
jgi:hypothetical protein